MMKEDIIEGIIALPPKLFYGIPGCVLILNRNKPKDRKNKIILIYEIYAVAAISKPIEYFSIRTICNILISIITPITD
jgi:type I restriction-modification system DNA methylase subunit